jgi:2-dehydro-3-deoxyphosphogluconate aldolase/(4S)-4-hydroxy-2-oxoglutarate aldolase
MLFNLKQSSQFYLDHILQNKIVAIVRGIVPTDVIKIAHALLAGGVSTMEVTLNSPGALPVITRLNKEMKNSMLIGAGTVLNATMAIEAIEAGACFIISPIVDEETIVATKKKGAVSIPGDYTPTEIYKAFSLGGEIIKVFPASSNVNYIKQVRAPLQQIPLMPTGGVSLQNIRDFKKAGAVAFGIGSSLVDAKQKITDEYLETITRTAKQFIQLVNEA